MDPKFLEFAQTQVDAPVQVSPMGLQAVLSGQTPTADTPMAAKIRAAYLQISPQQRLDNEPGWRYSINPVFWVNRTKGGTADWWQAWKTAPASTHSQLVEMYPFAYDFGTETQPAARVAARKFNNDGLDALFAQGDFIKAADNLFKAVTADSTYPYGAYNSGVLQMCLFNPEASIKMFLNFERRGASASNALHDHADLYRENMRRMIILLLSAQGSQRRIYAEEMDAAWSLFNVGQFRAAALVAGQAAAIDSNEDRPEAHLLVAMICAQQNRTDETVRWLQRTLERCKGPALKMVVALLRDAMGNNAAPAAAPTAVTPAATPPAAAPPAAPPATTNPPATQNPPATTTPTDTPPAETPPTNTAPPPVTPTAPPGS